MGAFASQFSHPHGPLGWMAGTIMAVENRQRNDLAVACLDVRPCHHILEIGFGPGVTIKRLAEQIGTGSVTGIDSSPVMVSQARKRNALAVQQGRVSLHRGSVERLPFAADSFDRVLAVNSCHHWPDPVANLEEVRRVLQPGGLLVIAEQPVWAEANADDHRIANDLAAQLRAAGFDAVEIVTRRMRPAPTICVRGVNPHIAPAVIPGS